MVSKETIRFRAFLIFGAHLDWEYSSVDLHFMTGTELTLPADPLLSLGGF
jgi:hypothetical protein